MSLYDKTLLKIKMLKYKLEKYIVTHVTDMHISTKDIGLLQKKKKSLKTKDMNRYVTEEELYVTNKYMKRHLISLGMRKMHIKIIMR